MESEGEKGGAAPASARVAVLSVNTLKELLDHIRWAHERRRGWVAGVAGSGIGWQIEIVIRDDEMVENGRIVKEGDW